MIKNKKKNKIARRILLSTLTFSSLIGVGLSLSSMNGFNSKEENLIDNQKNNEIIENNNNLISTRVETNLIQSPGVNFGDYYPFEIPIPAINTNVLDSHEFWNFFDIAGSVQPNKDGVTFRVTSVSLTNNGSNERSGVITIQAIISKWTDGTTISNSNKPLTLVVNNLRSVSGPTNIVANPNQKPLDNVEYASDIIEQDRAIGFLVPRNHIVNAKNSIFDSRFQLSTTKTPSFDNISGNLTIPATIGNYIDSSFRFVPESSGLFTRDVVIDGFKKIPGETKFVAKQPLASSTTPSVLLRSADSNGVLSERLIEQYFGEIVHPLTIKNNVGGSLDPQTKVAPNGFVIEEAIDEEGAIRVRLSVTGGYYGFDSQNRLIPIRPNPDGSEQKFTITIGGFSKFIEPVDNTMTIVIASIGGGVGLIAVIIALIFIIRFQKKKSEEIKKKKMMDDKLHSMSSKPKKGPEIANASGMTPGGGMAPGRPGAPGGPQAPGKYVPPTISVPKSNAPVVKRPSGPTTPPVKK
ncbi:MAG: hypothetical protein ACRDCD_02840 [Mycoplasmoidaceae bacterium]